MLALSEQCCYWVVSATFGGIYAPARFRSFSPIPTRSGPFPLVPICSRSPPPIPLIRRFPAAPPHRSDALVTYLRSMLRYMQYKMKCDSPEGLSL